jgi:hypothetical protein
VFVGPVKDRFSEVVYPPRGFSKSYRPGQSSCSEIWRFFVLNSFICLSSYLVSLFCPIYHFFVFLSSGVLLLWLSPVHRYIPMAQPSPQIYSYGSAQSTDIFLWLSPVHRYIPPIWSQHRLNFFPNNSSVKFVTLLPPK